MNKSINENFIKMVNEAIHLFNSSNFVKSEIIAKKIVYQFPNHPIGWKIIGSILSQTGRVNESLHAKIKAIELSPNDAEAHNNLGNTYREIGKFEHAEKYYKNAIKIMPNFAEALCNLANILGESGRYKEAIEYYQKSLIINDNLAVVHSNYGNILDKIGRIQEAELSYRHAIKINPQFSEAYSNLGNLLRQEGRLLEAKSACLQALELNPNLAEGHNHLGNVLRELNLLSAAEKNYRTAIALNPLIPEFYNNLGNVLGGMSNIPEANKSYLKALSMRSSYHEAHSNLILNSNYDFEISGSNIFQEAIRFSKNLISNREKKYTKWSDCKDKIRIGFLSGDLRNHPVGFFTENLFKSISKDQFELYAYSNCTKEDDLTKRVKGQFKKWSPIFHKTDFECANEIHEDSIDILVDLAGHTAANRLVVLSYKPAPIQVSWLGYCGTTGLEEVDYIIGDNYVTPLSEDKFYVEKIWRMPGSYICFSSPKDQINIKSLPVLKNNFITFGSFNNYSKINLNVLTLWAEILHNVKNSKLYLKSRQYIDQFIVQDLINKFENLKISRDRLIIEGPIESYIEHLESYNNIDIALDTFPYNGVTTTVEALWMGVPVVGLKGDRFTSHNGESILNNTGNCNWIANDNLKYIEKSIILASDINLLSAIRSNMRSKLMASSVFNNSLFTFNFENMLREMMSNYIIKNKIK
jgi:predicted O-linked N-acetylglucosamine transferase (SPINDLY family)